jgi:zinc protease
MPDATLDRSVPPAPGPVRAFDFPVVRRQRLENGFALLTARHGDLPIVTAELILDAGAGLEVEHQAGLAHLTAHALETGTATRSAERIAWELEYLGVELEVHASWDAVILGITVPRERLEPAFDLFADLVLRPSFPAEQVERLRDEQLAELLQRTKEPRALANDMAAGFIFPPDVPFARPLTGTAAAVAALDRDQVQTFFQENYAANRAALLLVGDIDAGVAEALARRHFAAWAPGGGAAMDFDVRGAVDRTTVFVVDRPGAVQSEIRIGHVGLDRQHPDYFPLVVLNTVLGGAFTSRLNMNLRERNGFTYGVQSGFAFRRRPGPFSIQTAVATDVTARAVEEVLREVETLRREPAAEEEIASAREYLTGVLPLELQTTGQLASRLADIVIHQLPEDYFRHHRERIAAVTAEDVLRVAREHLAVDRMAIVVVGAAAEIVQPLEALNAGPVEVHTG